MCGLLFTPPPPLFTLVRGTLVWHTAAPVAHTCMWLLQTLLDPEGLKRKGMVNTLSQVTCCYAAFVVFLFEKGFRATGNVIELRAVLVEEDVLIFNFTFTECILTCVGWNIGEGHPPLEEEERGIAEVGLLYSFLASVSVLCLVIERATLKVLRRGGGRGEIARERGVVDSGAMVLSSVSKTFLFVSFWLSINSAVYGAWASANFVQDGTVVTKVK